MSNWFFTEGILLFYLFHRKICFSELALSQGIKYLILLSFLYKDELNAELEELEQEDLDEQMLNIGGTEAPELPSVPDTDLPSSSKC